MIVVADTSPLTSLAAVGHFGLLQRVYGEIHIAEGVWDELNAGGTRWPGSSEVAAAPWVKRHPSPDTPVQRALVRDLGQGEAETIALGVDMGAGLALLDEAEGRSMAKQQGLRVMGVGGVLLAAKAKGHVDAVRPLLDALREHAGFRLSHEVYARLLALAGESGDP